eukprot:UN00360
MAKRHASNAADGIYNGSNGAYMEAMYQKWKSGEQVHASWDAYFKTGEFAAPPALTGTSTVQVAQSIGGSSAGAAGGVDAVVAKAYKLINAHRQHGHLKASIDPLGIQTVRGSESYRKQLSPEAHGITAADLEKVVDLSVFGETDTFGRPLKVKDLVATAEQTYSNTIGVEFEHVGSQEERDFLYKEFENINKKQFNVDQKVNMLKQLNKATSLEAFLEKKYNVKRFGLEGGESTIVALASLLEQSADNGVEEVVMGMAHRGRLNILTNIVGKPLEILLSEFQGNYDAREAHKMNEDGTFPTNLEQYPHAGDVKYHQGWEAENTLSNGKKVKVTMLPNPSHLETVNPLVVGYNRAIQDAKGDEAGDKSLPVMLHGDAAFAGQGVVYETMAMRGLKGYQVGGSVHIVINNQVGFTTDPECSRSGTYSSDVAKAFDAPVFHVNGDDVEAVARVSALAANYRQKFKKDVVIDLVCFRVNGHNELDQPSFTQPTMYEVIKQHKTNDVYQKYKKQVVGAGVVPADVAEAVEAEVQEELKQKFEDAKNITEKPHAAFERPGPWAAMAGPTEAATSPATGVKRAKLQTYADQLAVVPEGFQLHRGIANAYKDRAAKYAAGAGMDWGATEALAFSSLLDEGFDVRIAGQDAERGTFSHRHAVVHDQPTNENYSPLKVLKGVDGQKTKGKFTVVNSLLSEYAAMGFEYGHSFQSPNKLNIWEAQFGDFVNGAQIILDNYVNSAEYKWGRQSGLVLLLPHGYEGQGAEHSSARMERFLQSCNDDQNFVPQTPEQEAAYVRRNNWQVMNLTSSANYFHALRRQVVRNIRKPLVIMSPKSLLRHPAAASSMEQLDEQTEFKPVLTDDKIQDPAAVEKHLLVSGKVYFELLDRIEKGGIDENDIAITRLEQVAPFPFKEVRAEIEKFSNATTVWAQEEHQNMGAYSYVQPRLTALLKSMGKDTTVVYAGKPPAAAAATGSSKVHAQEVDQFFQFALKL